MAPIYYGYNVLLCILQVLHVFWFLTIVRMAHSYIISGKVDMCIVQALFGIVKDVTEPAEIRFHGIQIL